jgi:putative FmdB family regulatory protein
LPTYSYRCRTCGHAFDIQQAFTDDSLTVCPNCGGELRKVFNNIGVSFTGSGFYRNDSRAAEKSSSSAAPATGETSSSSSSPASPAAPASSPAPASAPAPSSSPSTSGKSAS